jgi:hypothetical protein
MMRGDQRDEVMKRDEGELYCVCVEAAHTGNDIICLSRKPSSRPPCFGCVTSVVLKEERRNALGGGENLRSER